MAPTRSFVPRAVLLGVCTAVALTALAVPHDVARAVRPIGETAGLDGGFYDERWPVAFDEEDTDAPLDTDAIFDTDDTDTDPIDTDGVDTDIEDPLDTGDAWLDTGEIDDLGPWSAAEGAGELGGVHCASTASSAPTLPLLLAFLLVGWRTLRSERPRARPPLA